MRLTNVVLSLGCLLAGCSRGADVQSASTSTSPEQNLPATAAAEQAVPRPAAAPAAAPAARMGGAVVPAGDYAVEVVASAEGSVDATVVTAAGALVPHAEVSALKVVVQGEGSARHDLDLAWDAPRAVFHGQAAGGARLLSGPLDVSLTVGGQAYSGKLELAAVLPRPQFGGHMIAVGGYSAEVVSKADGEIEVHLRDSAGAALEAGADFDLELRAQGKGGAMHEIALRWDAPRARFVGKLEADVQLATGPIELALRKGELAAQGRVELAALVKPPATGAGIAGDVKADAKASAAARADLKAKAKAKAELAAKLEAEAAAAKRAQARAKAKLAALEGKASTAAKLSVKAPQPSVSLKAGASGSADAKAAGSARTGTAAQASGAAKQEAGVKLGGGISLGGK